MHEFIIEAIARGGYLGIFVLMALGLALPWLALAAVVLWVIFSSFHIVPKPSAGAALRRRAFSTNASNTGRAVGAVFAWSRSR